jgi:PCFT/HCP family folate transporter-like MFS transporter 1/3
MASKAVDESEVGKIFALFGLLGAISSSLIVAAYQALYAATLETFPGAFLLLNSALYLASVPINFFFWMNIA